MVYVPFPNDGFDRDGLGFEEQSALGTDPQKKDTDGDGFDDGFEVDNAASGYDPRSSTTSSDINTEGDGCDLSDYDKIAMALFYQIFGYENMPQDPDSSRGALENGEVILYSFRNQAGRKYRFDAECVNGNMVYFL